MGFLAGRIAKDPPWYAVLREAWRVLLLQIYVFFFIRKIFLSLSCWETGIHTAKVFFAPPSGNLDNFQMQGQAENHSARFYDYAVGGPLSISTPYQAGVEYGCSFLAAFVQNVQKKLRKRLHTFVLYSTGEVGRRGNSKAMLTYSQFPGRINGVLENILLSIPKTFTSAQFMAAVKTFLPDECAQILSRTTIRGLHVWMARWYLNGNQTITKAGVKTIETVNGNKSTNALWNNPLK